MSPIKTFKIMKEAKEEAEKMKLTGWPNATVVRVWLDTKAKRKIAYQILAKGDEEFGVYLREDGFIN